MSQYVLDASVAVEYLLRTPTGLTIADLIDYDFHVAPELLDAEVLSVLRRAVQNNGITSERAMMAVDDLVRWPVERIPHRQLAHIAWRYRHSISAYDAFYVATAYIAGSPLMTADAKLTNASGLDVPVLHIPFVYA